MPLPHLLSQFVNHINLLCSAAAVALLLIAVPASSQEVSGQSSDSPGNGTPSTVAVNDITEDAAIADRLTKILESADWYNQLNVQSENGIVTLEGFTDTEEHRQWAGDLARRTEDVVAVINKIKVSADVDLASSKEVVRNSLDTLWRDFLARSPLLAAAVVILFFTGLLARLVAWILYRILDHRRLRTSLKDLIYQFSSIGVWIVGLLIATVVAFPGMTPSKALTVLGLGSVAIGFAFKDIFENFFAGILILWRYPFDRGDFISCSGITGRVEEITIRNTMIRRLDGELAVVPNATLFKNNVDVLTSQPQRRVRIICGVAYGENVDASREVILKAVQSCETIEGIRTVEVFAQEFADSSINFEVAWWTGSKPVDIRRSRDEVVAAIKRDLDAAGIEIPFPYRTLTFKDAGISQAIQRSTKPGRGRDDDV